MGTSLVGMHEEKKGKQRRPQNKKHIEEYARAELTHADIHYYRNGIIEPERF